MRNKFIQKTAFFTSVFIFIATSFFLTPNNAVADSGTCCPDEGICVIDGKVVGRTHYYKSDGKCDDLIIFNN